MLDDDVVHGEKRTYYSVRLIGIVVAIALLVSALAGITTTLLAQSSTNKSVYQGLVKACERGNEVRAESNVRIPAHEKDRDNLGKLANRLSDNRAAEASTFAAIGGAFGIDDKVDPLVKLLRKASTEDKAIADDESTVSFSPLTIIPCTNTKFVPKP